MKEDDIDGQERERIARIARRDYREILEMSAEHIDAIQSIGKVPKVSIREVDDVYFKLLIQDLRKERKRQVESLNMEPRKRKGARFPRIR